MPWFKTKVLKDVTTSETLTQLANELKFDVLCCFGYDINNCSFYTNFLDEESTLQNNEITLEAEPLQFLTSKDPNPI